MFMQRGPDRRVREPVVPEDSEDRRHIAERRRIGVSESTHYEFELLMSALGFRPDGARSKSV